MGWAADLLGRHRGDSAETRRAAMVARIRAGGVTDELVLSAMEAVDRALFLDDAEDAYADRALSIGYGQTISQPLMVAVIVAALELREGDRALDVGTGSGYQAAIMAACGARVLSIERIAPLAETAAERLTRLGLDVEVRVGDGSLGAEDRAPFDAIAVGAAAPDVPEPLRLQLATGGRLVVPVTRGEYGEELIRVRRTTSGWSAESLGPCRFVPLVGGAGYRDSAGDAAAHERSP